MNTIKHVPARVLNRRSGHSLEAEREQFDKQQAASISKAITAQEAPVKEKHARRIILGTHHEKGAFTFWSYAIGLPLSSSPILSWKFCHVLHKVLRDGHRNVLQDCVRHKSNVRDTGNLWHPDFPANLEVTDDELEKAAGTDVNNVFQLTVEMFDYQDCELKLAESVFKQMNTSIAFSQTSAGQCRLAPLIQVIQDCSHLYHYLVKLMFKLHSCLPADTLEGHRARFNEQFHSLKNFFNRTRDLLYFKRLIQIPRLPESPPNFLKASALAEHVKPVVVIPDETPEDDEPESLIEISKAPVVEQQQTPDIFDQTFGPPNGFVKDDRDFEIENLKREIEILRAELEKVKSEAQRYITQLRTQINSLEAELEEQRKQKQKALVDNEQLRDELEKLRKQKVETDSVQARVIEAEKKAQATDVRYNKLKEKHSELIGTHAELLRKSADTAKQLTVTQQTQEEVENTKQQMQFELDQIKRESEMKLEEQTVEMEDLKRQLETTKAELINVQQSLSFSEQSGSNLNARLHDLQSANIELEKALAEKKTELSSVRSVSQDKESCLQQDKEKIQKEVEGLQAKLRQQAEREQNLQYKQLDDQFKLLQGTVTEAENIIQDALARLDDPLHIRCTSSPDYLISRAQAAIDSIDLLQCGHTQYMKNKSDASGLIAALAQFSHLTADTVVNGSATSHTAATDQADRLMDSCRTCGEQSLTYLKGLKNKQTLAHSDPSAVRKAILDILGLGEELRPKLMDVRQEELGDMVDKEMAATSAAIEDAVRRIEDMMKQTRKESSGMKLEVNERILNCCTDLMKAIRLLVMASTDLQKEIVESSRGAATPKEFYAKNSRWTEGLISASKAVGWGATQLVESADKVVLHTGKYEELIVCSHEIAASTAQLVAASKVKADKNSNNLTRLQQASRHVNEMTANVVASTKSGQDQIEEKDTMDFSGMSLIKLKRQEMETQVKVLELESKLEQERLHLGELRKKHYAMAGIYDGVTDEVEKTVSAQKPGILKKPPLAQKPAVILKQDNQENKNDGVYRAHLFRN